MNYPAYIQQMLDQAREMGQWYGGQAEAMALCFDILALFPEHAEASGLIWQFCCDEWLIYDTRNAIQQQIDEWDDRPWQERHRVALSFRFMSRWDGWQREYDEEYAGERNGPPDVYNLLDEGKGLLIQSYCLGDEKASDAAWPLFVQAFVQTSDPRLAMLWVGKLYAEMGFLADAGEVLASLCSRFDDANARRLFAEVIWWRDNSYRLPWLPPAGDGTRYKRMMACIDPNAPDDAEVIRDAHKRIGQPSQPIWQPAISPDLAERVMPILDELDTPATSNLVDWSFLDSDDGQPGDMPEWARRSVKLLESMSLYDEELVYRYRWSRPIQPPSTPRRYNPTEPIHEEDDFDYD